MIALVLPLLVTSLLLAPDSASPDAIILSDDASWALKPNGEVVEEHHRRVRVLSDRAHRRHADPRIEFWDGAESVDILLARVTQADGTVVETPAYGRNLVSPGGYSGWPAFAAAREWVISMSGIEPQAVIELHWKKTTGPGTKPWLWADIRLAEGDPVESRSVTLTLPEGRTLLHQTTGIPAGSSEPEMTQQAGNATYRWKFKDLAADPDEPQAPSWRKRAPRLVFTTCPTAGDFIAAVLQPVETAASGAESLKKPIESAVKDPLDDAARVRAVQKLLRDSMNFVDQAEAWERMNCRPAEEVFSSNYANPLESGAVLIAMLRAAGFPTSPALLVEPPSWDAHAPVPTGVSAVVAQVDLAGQRLWVHPAKGVVSSRSFPNHLILGTEGTREFPGSSRMNDAAEIAIQGQLKVETDGMISGELKLRLTGHAFDPEQLRAGDEQKSFLGAVIGRVAEGLNLDTFSVATLSDEEFGATAKVKSAKPLPALGERRRLSLAADFPFLAATPLPLAAVQRKLPVQLTGSVVETLELRVDLPEGQRPLALPSHSERSFGEWASVKLDVSGVDTPHVSIRRTIRIARPDVSSSEFIPLRDALNELRADSSRTIVFGK